MLSPGSCPGLVRPVPATPWKQRMPTSRRLPGRLCYWQRLRLIAGHGQEGPSCSTHRPPCSPKRFESDSPRHHHGDRHRRLGRRGAADLLDVLRHLVPGLHVQRQREHVEPHRHEPPPRQLAGHRAGEDHGRSSRHRLRAANRRHHAAAGGPLPGRRQRPQRHPGDHRRPSRRHRFGFRPGGGHRPGGPRRRSTPSRPASIPRSSIAPIPSVPAAPRSAPSPRTAWS